MIYTFELRVRLVPLYMFTPSNVFFCVLFFYFILFFCGPFQGGASFVDLFLLFMFLVYL